MIYLNQIKTGCVDNFSYIIADSKRRVGTVIDPGWPGDEADKVLEKARVDSIEIKYVIATHFHSDHIGGVNYLMSKTGAGLLVHETELYSMECLGYCPDIIVKDNDFIDLGGLIVKIIHTPGHSPGSICLLSNGKLFTGDTLFVGGCGRADLPRGNPEDLYKSLNEKIKSLSDAVEIYPGHDYGITPFSTIRREKLENQYLKCGTLKEFIKLRMG